MTVTACIITETSGNNFNYSGNKTMTLYNVQSEDFRKSAGVIDLPMPTLDSDGKIVMDLMGASREITIEGVVTIDNVGGTAANLAKYALDIVGLASTGKNTLINGSQGTNQYTYQSIFTQETAIKVVITESTAKFEKGNPNSFTYNITMMEYGTGI